MVGVRPHDMVVRDGEGQGLPAEVIRTEHLGRNNFVDCRPVHGSRFLYGQDMIQIETDAAARYEPGTRLVLSAPTEAIRLFDGGGSLIQP